MVTVDKLWKSNSNKDSCTQDHLRSAVRYFVRVDSPVYLGEVSLELRVPLYKAHVIVDRLCEENIVRPLSCEEKRELCIERDHLVWTLTERKNCSSSAIKSYLSEEE